MNVLRIGTRPSRLALKQVEEIKAVFPALGFEAVAFKTKGDKDKFTPLAAIEGSDFFTREIEEALLNRQIDAAVHSAKDLEQDLPRGLVIAAVTSSISQFECLVSRGNKKLDELKSKARIATSSSKRKTALLNYRPDFKVCDLRGDIDERLAQLDEGKFDALIMAHAALIRLGLEKRVSQIIRREIIEPHPLQGCLAIQVRSGDRRLLELFSVLDSRKAPRARHLALIGIAPVCAWWRKLRGCCASNM